MKKVGKLSALDLSHSVHVPSFNTFDTVPAFDRLLYKIKLVLGTYLSSSEQKAYARQCNVNCTHFFKSLHDLFFTSKRQTKFFTVNSILITRRISGIFIVIRSVGNSYKIRVNERSWKEDDNNASNGSD